MIYRFYLTVGSTVTEVFPLGFLDTTLVDEQERSEMFYRRKFAGTLIFTNNNGDSDFDLLYGVEVVDPCGKLLLLIERNGDYYWDGYFSTTDGKFDLDNCTFEVTPLPNDDYEFLYENADIQYNILDIATVVTTDVNTVFTETYDRNRWLTDVIDFLADKINPGGNTSYTFFTDTPNYVTLAANKLTLLTIAQKSDIINPGSTEPATTAMMSWNELMFILNSMFNVYWNYDSGTDTINVEHVSWVGFSAAAGMDLRTQLISRASNKYKYLKDEMPKFEKFSFMEADDSNFVGVPIYYDSKCVNQDKDRNVKEVKINVTTDLEYIEANPDYISADGFVILCNYDDGGGFYYVESQPGSLDMVLKLNGRLSWANLHNSYFRHDRVLITGYMNDTLTTFWTAKKTISQKCFAIVCPDDAYDPSDEITTELGETYLASAKARVKTSSLNPNGEMDFNLVYGPADNVNTGVDDVKFILLVQVGIDTINAYLSEPADADYDILVHEKMYDETCTLNCTGVDETWTISTGETVSSFTLADLCHSFDADWSIELILDVSDMVGWNYTFEPDLSVNFPGCP